MLDQKRRLSWLAENLIIPESYFPPGEAVMSRNPRARKAGEFCGWVSGEMVDDDLMVLSVFLIFKNPDKRFEF